MHPTTPVAGSVRRRLVVWGLLVGLVCAEAILRLAGFSFPTEVRLHPTRGFTREPGLSFRYTEEGDAWVLTNAAGYRDREHNRTKPAGSRRLAVLGDSFAEAWEVDLEETFWSLLERALNDGCRLGGVTRVEVLNFGIRGYTTSLQYLQAREEVFDYGPDAVLLAMYLDNDVVQYSRALYTLEYYPYFVLGEDGALELDTSFRTRRYRFHRSRWGTAWRTLKRHSRLLQLVQRARDRFAGGAAGGYTWDGHTTIYSPPVEPAWRDAWHVTERLVLQLDQLVASHQARFGVVAVPTPEQVEPDDRRRASVQREFGIDDYFYPDGRIAALAFPACRSHACSTGSPPSEVSSCMASPTPSLAPDTGTKPGTPPRLAIWHRSCAKSCSAAWPGCDRDQRRGHTDGCRRAPSRLVAHRGHADPLTQRGADNVELVGSRACFDTGAVA